MSEHPDATWVMTSGLSLRDYFAAAALQGLLASGTGVIVAVTQARSHDPDEVANAAYAYADAMLKERETNAERQAPLGATPDAGDATGTTVP